MNIRRMYPNSSFIKIPYGSALMSKMLSVKTGKGKSVKKMDGFAWQSDLPDAAKAKISKAIIYGKPQIRKAAAEVPKATLADVTAAFDAAKAENKARLENAGNEIIAVNDRAGKNISYASTRINGARYDYQSSEYISNGAYLSELDKNSFDRQMINRQIGNILSESGITISDNENYTFTVDAYTNRITVDGSDKGKAAEIENVLNKGQNGKNLYDHIRLCGTWENNSQIFKEGQTLRYSNELVKELIGVNLAECTQNGNDFITPDNRSVKEMLHEYAKANPTDGFTVESHTKLLHSYIDHAAEYGYSDSSLKMDLSIKFNSTGLHDIGQKNSYGNGDTDWIDDYVNDLGVSSGKKVMTTFI